VFPIVSGVDLNSVQSSIKELSGTGEL